MEDQNEGVRPPRLVMIIGMIDWEMVERTAEAMAVLNALSEAPIVVHITSPGGMLDPAMAIYDLFLLSRAPVITCVFGCAGSSASIIAQAGVKRIMAPNANMMIHTGSLGVEGRFKEKDFEELTKGAHDNNSRVFRLYAERTGNSVKQIREWCEAETEMTAEQAVRRGFADSVLRKPRMRRQRNKAKQRSS